jgi:putative flippase GtrA
VSSTTPAKDARIVLTALPAVENRPRQDSAQFARFLLVGGFAASLNFFSRIALSPWLPFAAAIIVAYLIGFIAAFVLNRIFVFTVTTNRLQQQMFWFFVVNVVALAQTLVVSLLFAHYVLPFLGVSWHAEEVAHAAGVATPIFTSYIGHKRLSFK